MKALILAAGQGTRLAPLTDDRPKCLVEYKGRPLLEYLLSTFRACDLTDITLIGGYKHECLEPYGLPILRNNHFASTNMVETLFCAEQEMTDDLIISYADIIYTPEVLQKLIDSPHSFSVVVDQDWLELWKERMSDPLADAETLRIAQDGTLKELGKKPTSYDEIEGQYIGLIKISKEALDKVRTYYHSLDRNALYDGKDFRNMYMTSFIQSIIDHLMPVHPIYVQGGWMEVDEPSDLRIHRDIELVHT